MSRLWLTGCMAVGLVVSAGLVQAADRPVTVTVNGQAQPFTPPVLVRDGKPYLPVRPLASAIMAGLSYDPATGTVKLSYCSHTARLRKAQGIIVNGSFYVPLRTVADALAIRITWSPRRALVSIDLGGG